MDDAPRCPRCDSRDVIWVVYGLPSEEMVEESIAGRVALGGCTVSGLGLPTTFARTAATSGARLRQRRRNPRRAVAPSPRTGTKYPLCPAPRGCRLPPTYAGRPLVSFPFLRKLRSPTTFLGPGLGRLHTPTSAASPALSLALFT